MTEFAGATVLVVDDSEVILESVRCILEQAGYRVLTRNKSAGAVSAILQDRPDLVLLDVNMPGVSGDTIASILRRTNAEGHTVVVLHSSLPAEVLKSKVAQTGAHGFLRKTDNVLEFSRQVNAWMKKAFTDRKLRHARALASESTTVGTPESGRLELSNTLVDPVSVSRLRASQSTPVDSRAEYSSAQPPSRGSSSRLRAANMSGDPLPVALFVDDDLATLASFRRCMVNEEVTCEFAESSEHALTRITSTHPPDVVICDILMPNLSGAELFQRALEANPSWRYRFVFVTGAGSVNFVAEFLRTPGIQVLYKPVHPERLKQAIRYCTAGARIFAAGGKSDE